MPYCQCSSLMKIYTVYICHISILMFVKSGNYKSMHHHLDLLRAYCNQLALRLVQKEHEENQLSIQKQGSLLYEHTLIHPQLHLYATEDKSNIKALTLAEKALLMAELAERESILSREKIKLTSDKNEEESSLEIKIEENDDKKEFPWDTVNNLNPFSRFSKIKLKCLLTSFFQSHPLEVKNTLQKFRIKNTDFQEALKAKKTRDKRIQLKKEVLERSNDRQLSFNEFKILARRIYTNRWFRPTDPWCFSFIRKHKLHDCVITPYQ